MNSIQKAKIDELRSRLAAERGITTPLLVTENNDGSVTVLVNGSGHVTIGVRAGIDLPNVRSYPEAMEAAVHADELEARCSNGYRIGRAPRGGSGKAASTDPGKRAATADPYHFALQFGLSEIDGLVARRLMTVAEEKAMEAGRRIAGGNYSRENLRVIVDWKMEGPRLRRVISFLDKNKDAKITDALCFAVAAPDERSAVVALDRLDGVGVPVASAILTTINPEKYTIIDVYALKSLGVRNAPTGSVDYYLAYLRECRELAHQFNISLRKLDHALWQWGYDHSRPRRCA